jgi:hypothetical protein
MTQIHLSASPCTQQNKCESTSTLTVVSNFAWQHLKSATLFRDQVVRLERAQANDLTESRWGEIRSYASSCIMASVASLEALINELFIAPNCPLRPMLPNFEVDFWGRNGIEKKSALFKYQHALSMLGAEKFDATTHPYRDVGALVELRNMFVHYKPTWDPDREQKVKLVEFLEGKFEHSRYASAGDDFVTGKCMSSGCATWAVSATLAFLREFSARTSIDPGKMHGFWLLEIPAT